MEAIEKMVSPYFNQPVEQWAETTDKLIRQHPLTAELILKSALISWSRLWSTWIGDNKIGFPICDIDPPATVIGYMFEKLFAKELAVQLPGLWRGGTGSEKDLHCINNSAMSVEMKASGQLGYKIYGNRSYGQILENLDTAKKDKSGYYITVNFSGKTLTLLRFGWIDSTDWQAQKSATGQMAGLPNEVYNHKLCIIPGTYILKGPVKLLDGVGDRAAEDLSALGITTISDLIHAQDLPYRYEKLQTLARQKYLGLY